MRARVARRVLALSGVGVVLALFASSRAVAGTDVFSNIAPASPLGSAAEFLRYPLSHYGLDKHFSAISTSLTGGVDASGLLPTIAWFFAAIIWFATSFLAKVVIELFAFAFSLDLVNGSEATGGAGALGPVSQAIHSIYAEVFGAPWLVLAFSAVALWAMWRALVQRRYVETAGALALSVIYIVVALFFVVQPGQTIGQASRWTNEMSQAFLSISTHGDPSGGAAATADDADQLWGLLVERPWAVLEFGGLEHCAINGTGDEKSDPESAPVRPLSKDPGQSAVLSRRLAAGTEVAAEGKTCVNNANKYSSHFLRFGPETDERGDEYDALDHGDSSKLPEADDEAAGYTLGVADKPATDAMEEGGQYQRLLVASVVAVGETGAFILLGALSIGVILSQVLLLLLLAFSPVALVAAAIPGRGHDFFKAWLEKLAGYLLRKAAYSLVLAVLLAVNSAIGEATSQLGWLFAFGLQAVFFWAVLIQRHTLAGGIIGLATGPRAPGRDLAVDAIALYGGARLGLGALRGVGGTGGAALSRLRRRRGEGDPRRPSPGGVRHTQAVAAAASAEGASDREAGDAEGTSRVETSKSEARGEEARGGSAGGTAVRERVVTSSPDAEDKGSPKDRGEEDVPVAEDGPEAAGNRDGEDERPAGRGASRGPGTPTHPDVVADREGDDPGPAGEDRPRRRRQADRSADAGEGAAQEPDGPRGHDRRPRPTDRRSSDPARRDAERPARRPSADEGGRTKAAPEGSDLSEELRAERRRPTVPPGPADALAAEPTKAGAEDLAPPPRVAESTPAEPTSPPRRRRLRLPGRDRR